MSATYTYTFNPNVAGKHNSGSMLSHALSSSSTDISKQPVHATSLQSPDANNHTEQYPDNMSPVPVSGSDNVLTSVQTWTAYCSDSGSDESSAEHGFVGMLKRFELKESSQV